VGKAVCKQLTENLLGNWDSTQLYSTGSTHSTVQTAYISTVHKKELESDQSETRKYIQTETGSTYRAWPLWDLLIRVLPDSLVCFPTFRCCLCSSEIMATPTVADYKVILMQQNSYQML